MKALVFALAASIVLFVGAPALAFAAPNPAGHGQPSVECGAEGGNPVMPNGFSSPGFVKAETHYAGSEDSHSFVSGNPHAVSQYDVACYQLSQRPH